MISLNGKVKLLGKGKNLELSYKVRGNFSPNGLQKVFFSFHPADFEQMKKIIDDILGMTDCVAYYHSDDVSAGELNIDDCSLKLGEMKLFVVIVSTNYLMHDSFAKSWEYGFAVTNNIPILPIAVEPGLESSFTVVMNQIGKGYGDRQLLNSQIDDKTAITYRQKLLRDLNTILVSDKEIEKIKKAFNGQLFLSYRKKDRKYANELMRTIHSIPSLQNISIWYDEFISTGENWSDQIENALKKSDVFLLMVTPSIMEPDNYVIRKEYPEAIKQNKKIVSARKTVASSDAIEIEKLKELFPTVKTFVDGDNADEMEEALKELSDKENRSPEKDYQIGLAFFNGIDVEKDNERAVSLIIAAAQKDFPDAISKLSDMYWNGDGIPVNYENSISWKRKLVDLYSNQFDDIKDIETMMDYVRALESLASCLYELSSFRDSLRYSKALVELLDQITSFSGSERFYDYQIRAYSLCGQNLKRLGLYDQALIYTEKDCQLSLKHYKINPSTNNYHNLSVAYQRTGDIYYAEGKLEKAKEEYLKAIEIDEKIDIQLKSADSAYSLSVDMLVLGNIYMKHGKYEEANRLYGRATILRKQILNGEDTDDHRNKYAEAVLSRGTSMLLCGNSEEANLLLNTAKDILLNLAETNGTIEAQYACSEALNRCAKACEEKGDFQNALNYYTDSLTRRKKILSRIRTCEAVYEYARTQFLRANSYQTVYDNAMAKIEYEDVVGLLKTILARDRNGSIHHLQAEAAFERFKLDTFSGKQYLQYAIDAWKWLSEKEIENHKFQKQYELCKTIYQRCYPE